MNWRSPDLAPTLPRPTMLALLLGVLCLLATVPSTEAAPVSVSSLPSLSSPAGILLAVLSVVIALTLVIVLVFVLKKKWKKLMNKIKGSKKGDKKEEKGTEQPEGDEQPRRCSVFNRSYLDPSSSDPAEPEEPVDKLPDFHFSFMSHFPPKFNKFLENWNAHTAKEMDQIIAEMVQEFPKNCSAYMAMDAFKTMVTAQLESEVVCADVWFRMLRFIMMLDRHLAKWDQTDDKEIAEEDKNIPSHTHASFRRCLVRQAELILQRVGIMEVHRIGAKPEPAKGFLRMVAFLLGFVCKDHAILKEIDDVTKSEGFALRDASRAVVWGYRRWMDDAVRATRGMPTPAANAREHETFDYLMWRLRRRSEDTRKCTDDGTEAQHLLFALGFGYEPEAASGPVAYMHEEQCREEEDRAHLNGDDYLWLLRGRDLAMGNAWQWMCHDDLSEHDRMAQLFGHQGRTYAEVVDTVMKYEQEYSGEEGEGFEAHALRYYPDIVETINFAEHRAWYERLQKGKRKIGEDLEEWLREDYRQWYFNEVPYGTKPRTVPEPLGDTPRTWFARH